MNKLKKSNYKNLRHILTTPDPISKVITGLSDFDYVSKAIANDKKDKVDKIMIEAKELVRKVRSEGSTKAIWAGFRKKIRRIL